MKRNPEIDNELSALNSSLAGWEPKTPFRVPSGYFNTVATDILMTVSPSDETLSEKVPEGYFNDLVPTIMAKIRQEEEVAADESLSPALRALQQKATFIVPVKYFEDLPEIILNRIKEEDNRQFISAPLREVKNINPYSLPKEYFETLPSIVLQKVKNNDAPVIKLGFHRSVIKYALAAVCTGLLGLSLFSVFNNPKPIVSTAAVNDHTMKTAQAIIQEGNFEDVLSSLSDQDIVEYLNKNGEDVNAALVASVAVSNNLPDQMEYLVDDNTLNKLLDGVIKEKSFSN